MYILFEHLEKKLRVCRKKLKADSGQKTHVSGVNLGFWPKTQGKLTFRGSFLEEWQDLGHFYYLLETTQAMLWFSSKSIIQKNGNIRIFQRALKLWEITPSFISLHWKCQDNSNSFLIAATTWSFEP